eukprot:9374159-Pyramimonas_sp.AAC.1
MTSGSAIASHMSLNSAKARCHCSHVAQALIPALWLMTLGSVLDSPMSLSKARRHCSPFSHALIAAL